MLLLCSGKCSAVCFPRHDYQDFTGFGPYLVAFGLSLAAFGGTIWLLSWFGVHVRMLTILYDLCGVLLFSCYTVYDTQLMLGEFGGHKGLKPFLPPGRLSSCESTYHLRQSSITETKKTIGNDTRTALLRNRLQTERCRSIVWLCMCLVAQGHSLGVVPKLQGESHKCGDRPNSERSCLGGL